MSELAHTETTIPALDSDGEFKLAWNQATAISQSDLIPKAFAGNIPNCLIALNLANRIGADPMMVMQNVAVIHGKPSLSASFLIACFNMTGRFTPIQYRFTGEGTDRTCVAHCLYRETGETIEGPPVSIGMAIAEGWMAKTGSKWKTLPDLMQRYRAATFLIRTVAPEIALGLHTSEEIHDMEPTPRGDRPSAQAANEALEKAVDVTPKDGGDSRNPDDHPEDF